MAKVKLKIAIAAVLLIAAAVFVYFVHFAPLKLDGPAEVQVWYVGNTVSDNFDSLIKQFNSEDGKEQEITVKAMRFDSELDLLNAVKSGANSKNGLPDVIMCDPNFSAYLKSSGLLADMEEYITGFDTGGIDKSIIKACTYEEELVCLPIVYENDVLIVNTKLCGEADKLESFEELCETANGYYDETSESYFTITDYSAFFNSAMAQIGDEFRAENPFDSENDNVRYIYDLLATAAFKRGFAAATDNPAAMVARRELVCAVASTSQVMQAEEYIDMNDIVFKPVPCMENGSHVYTLEVTGMSILKSDSNTETAAAIFIKWFASDDICARYAGFSGYIPATGNAGTEGDMAEPVIYSELINISDSMEFITCEPNPDYAENCYEFNSIMDNIMNKSLS